MNKRKYFAKTFVFTMIVIFILAGFAYMGACVWLKNTQTVMASDAVVFKNNLISKSEYRFQIMGKEFSVDKTAVNNVIKKADRNREFIPDGLEAAATAVNYLCKFYDNTIGVYISELVEKK